MDYECLQSACYKGKAFVFASSDPWIWIKDSFVTGKQEVLTRINSMWKPKCSFQLMLK